MTYTYDIGKWERERQNQICGYTFVCPSCKKPNYFIGKGEKRIGRYCTWCGADNKGGSNVKT